MGGDNYSIMVMAMPVYWFLVMIPAGLKSRRIFNPTEPALKASGLTEPLNGDGVVKNKLTLADVNPEPRSATANIINDPENPDSGFVRRCQAAHENGWEGFILYISAATAVALSGSDIDFCNTCAAIILLCRFFYNIAYIRSTSPSNSFFRSAAFFVQFLALCALWIKASYDILN